MIAMKRTKIGIIGCGAISGAYMSMCPKFDVLEIAACADLIMERAQARAAEFNIPRACSVAELLADPEIAIVVNLTIPKAHFEVAMAAVKAGKSVWNEKPLTVTREQGKQLLDAAQAASSSMTVGSANRSAAPLSCCATVMKAGIRIRNSTTRSVAARCSTWARITSPRW